MKSNLPDVLRRELARPAWARETVAVGTATDPYQPIEGHYKLTRRCLEALVHAATPFSIVTKGPMVVRDTDLLVLASRAAGCQVYLSVPSVDEQAWATLEPGTAPPRQRLRAVRQLSDAGVDAAVLMMPLVPGVTTSRSAVRATLQAVADAGVRVAGSGVTHLEDGVRQHFFAFLERTYPDLLEGYRGLYKRPYAPKDYVAKSQSDGEQSDVGESGTTNSHGARALSVLSNLQARGPTPAPRARATQRRGAFRALLSSSPCPRSYTRPPRRAISACTRSSVGG